MLVMKQLLIWIGYVGSPKSGGENSEGTQDQLITTYDFTVFFSPELLNTFI